MTDFNKMTKDINSTLYERAKSPLYSSFAISWIIANWKFFYVTVFLSRADLFGLSKLQYITNDLYDCSFGTFCKLLIIPASMTTLFIWIFPALELQAFKAVQKARTKRNTERLKILGEGSMSGKHFIQLKKKLDDTFISYSDVMEEKDNIEREKNEALGSNLKLQGEIERLKGNINEMETQNKNLIIEAQHIENNITDIFKGIWNCRYKFPQGDWTHEFFKVQEGYKYFGFLNNQPGVEPRLYYEIDRVIYNKIEGKLTFRKIGIGAKVGNSTLVTLQKKENGTFEGTETGNVEVKYEPYKNNK
jgi:hypothetical protein